METERMQGGVGGRVRVYTWARARERHGSGVSGGSTLCGTPSTLCGTPSTLCSTPTSTLCGTPSTLCGTPSTRRPQLAPCVRPTRVKKQPRCGVVCPARTGPAGGPHSPSEDRDSPRLASFQVEIANYGTNEAPGEASRRAHNPKLAHSHCVRPTGVNNSDHAVHPFPRRRARSGLG